MPGHHCALSIELSVICRPTSRGAQTIFFGPGRKTLFYITIVLISLYPWKAASKGRPGGCPGVRVPAGSEIAGDPAPLPGPQDLWGSGGESSLGVRIPCSREEYEKGSISNRGPGQGARQGGTCRVSGRKRRGGCLAKGPDCKATLYEARRGGSSPRPTPILLDRKGDLGLSTSYREVQVESTGRAPECGFSATLGAWSKCWRWRG
jgi:hypothetical protein